MSANKKWLRTELIAILGQPVKEWITKSQSDVSPEGVNIGTALKLDAPEEGAFKILKWRCTPLPSGVDDLAAEWDAMRAESVQNTPLMARTMHALEVISDCCIAASKIENGENKVWVTIRVCSRHAKAGLTEDHSWGMGA